MKQQHVNAHGPPPTVVATLNYHEKHLSSSHCPRQIGLSRNGMCLWECAFYEVGKAYAHVFLQPTSQARKSETVTAVGVGEVLRPEQLGQHFSAPV